MLTVSDASRKLGISETRVRALISKGVLSAQKIGRQWFIFESSVDCRLRAVPKPGRPARMQGHNIPPDEASLRVHELYLMCDEAFSRATDPAFLAKLESADERDFAVYLANFFLAKKQYQLVELGVF